MCSFSNGSSYKSNGGLRVSSDSDDEMSPLSKVGHHLPTPEIPSDDVGRKNMFDESDDDDDEDNDHRNTEDEYDNELGLVVEENSSSTSSSSSSASSSSSSSSSSLSAAALAGHVPLKATSSATGPNRNQIAKKRRAKKALKIMRPPASIKSIDENDKKKEVDNPVNLIDQLFEKNETNPLFVSINTTGKEFIMKTIENDKQNFKPK